MVKAVRRRLLRPRASSGKSHTMVEGVDWLPYSVNHAFTLGASVYASRSVMHF
jgi:hypothetical protein